MFLQSLIYAKSVAVVDRKVLLPSTTRVGVTIQNDPNNMKKLSFSWHRESTQCNAQQWPAAALARSTEVAGWRSQCELAGAASPGTLTPCLTPPLEKC